MYLSADSQQHLVRKSYAKSIQVTTPRKAFTSRTGKPLQDKDNNSCPYLPIVLQIPFNSLLMSGNLDALHV